MSVNLKKIVTHLCTWLVLVFMPQILFAVPFSLKSLGYEVILIIPTIVIFYAHVFLSLPYFFYEKKYFYYSLSLILLAFFFVLSIKILEPVHLSFIDYLRENSPDAPRPRFHKNHSLLMPPSHKWTSFLITITASAIYSISLRNVERERRLRELEKQQAISNLQLLKWQLSPHFLFNALNSIYSLSLKKSEELPKVILTVSDLLRYVTYDSEKNSVNVQKEIDYLNDYIKLQKLRLSPESSVEFVVENNNPEAKIAPMILVPFVENAFKHGANAEGVVTITLYIVISEKEVYFRILNTKHFENQRDKTHGIGVENVQTRLNLLYGSKHSLNIFDRENEYEVLLKLQL